VAAGANQDEQFVGKLVNEEPIAAEMTFPEILPVSGELVVPAVRWKGVLVLEKPEGLKKPLHVAPGALNALVVLLELSFADDLAHQLSKSALRASTDAKRGRSSWGSFMASRVVELVSEGSSMSKVTTARAGPVTGSARVTVPSSETVASTVIKVAGTVRV
jgi:hypothetical protein